MLTETKTELDIAFLQSLLRKPLSRRHIMSVANMVAHYPEMMSQAIILVQSDDEQEAMRASWMLSHLYDKKPQLLAEWQPQLVDIGLKTPSDSVRRNLLRIIEGLSLDDQQSGFLFDACLRWMISENYSIAVRANAMQLLYRICCREPELVSEVEQHIRAVLPFGSAGFRSRANIVLNNLTKIQNK